MGLREQSIEIDNIYIPVKRRQTIDVKNVEEIAESIIENGLKNPISVRPDGDRFVLVSGLHRLEACRALGERTINSIVVGARQF